MDMMDGLAGTLAGMKEDAMVAAKMGGGFVLGVALASVVSNFVNDIGVTTEADGKMYVTKDGAKVEVAGSLEQIDAIKPVPHWVGPVAVMAVGLALFTKTRDSYPALGGANGLGMIGYGLGRLAKNFLNRAAAKETTPGWASSLNKYVPFGATDNYESTILAGLGYNDMSVNRYLPRNITTTGWNGLGADMRSPGAPTFVETVNGAPTTITAVNGAPTTITSLQGLSATLM